MIKHYLAIAWRNLRKNKIFSIINIVGLAVGLTCCLLMTLYVKHELSYDDFEKKGDRIVRVIMEYGFGGSVQKGNFTSTKVATAFKRNFPEIESAVRMGEYQRAVRYEDKLFNEKKFMYADSSFFDLFSFRLLSGNAKEALSGTNKVILTEATSKKYFGNSDPIGKTIKVGSQEDDYLVTGIIQDCPSNSQIKFDFLASFSTLAANQEETYFDANYTTYLLLKDKNAITSLQAKIPAFMKKETSDFKGNDYITFGLEPMKTIHLHSEYGGFEPNNSINYIYIVSGVAFLMLLIACFTYINLSTARAMERAKEVGIRKVAGALRTQIFWQFISESFIVTISALVLSVSIALLVLPAFNRLAERNLNIGSLFSPFFIAFSIVILSCISLLAGSYPALIFTRFQPIRVLKGAFKNTGSGLWLRKSLIVFQFAISVFLIVATFIIQNQLHYIQTKDIGFNREHVLVLPMDNKIQEKMELIKTVFKSNPGIVHVSKAASDPVNIISGYTMRKGDSPEGTGVSVNANPVDEEFISTTGIHLITGSDFTTQDVKDALNPNEKERYYHFILNESAAKQLGWTPQEAIGKKMFLMNRPGEVKAVVHDFNFASFHDPIKPLVLFNDEWSNTMLVKVSGNNIPATISFLQSKWKELVPHRPCEYHFLDEDFDKLYSSELRLGRVLNIFTAIAILLACLGLFGLSAYAIQQRTKEIGIRKVLGATISNVITLLSKDFIGLVIVAMLIAFPVAGWLMHKWLEDFVYRISISWWMFAIAALIALLITIGTISFQAVKAAFSNPVKSLRTE
jgi:putative ABC transport system permease protein